MLCVIKLVIIIFILLNTITMNNTQLLEHIQKKCPWKFVQVWDCKTFGGETRQAFLIARNNYLINWVAGQYAEVISLWLENNQRKYQIFWWNGGQFIHRNTDKNNENEKFHALWLEKMPSRLSKDYKKAINKVCDSYNTIIQDISSRWLTRWL